MAEVAQHALALEMARESPPRGEADVADDGRGDPPLRSISSRTSTTPSTKHSRLGGHARVEGLQDPRADATAGRLGEPGLDRIGDDGRLIPVNCRLASQAAQLSQAES